MVVVCLLLRAEKKKEGYPISRTNAHKSESFVTQPVVCISSQSKQHCATLRSVCVCVGITVSWEAMVVFCTEHKKVVVCLVLSREEDDNIKP